LLREVSSALPEARSFRRDDLPEAVRQRHSQFGTQEARALQAISDHSALIVSGIRSTIGRDLHLGRETIVTRIIEGLASTQVVVVSGGAGSGKSGVAKAAIEQLAADHFAFGFRAEEFTYPHFDETLQRSQIPANAAMIGAVLASQDRKVLLVESAERLLEASTRDAFSDLLTLIANDRTWCLILTCRDYSTDLVRTCFLETARVGHSVVTVPPLDDGELKEVETAYPALARPLGNPALRGLLRNPYVLDKALQIPWSDGRPLPQSEREFRARFWQDIIRAEHRSTAGLPRRREEAFVAIALRRARGLTLYAACSDLDPEVIDFLRHDSLIVSPPTSNVLVAPAHDVLEDWAILQWIDEQNATHHGSLRDLSENLGAYPAIRRTFRKWAAELIERDAAAADALFQSALADPTLPSQFRDDALVALLRSSASPAFLERHWSVLMANDKLLLRRVIHLLRVACVATPDWLATTTEHASLFDVPDGPSWSCVLELIANHLTAFSDGDHLLLLGLVEDWAKGVSWQRRYPKGARAAATIAHRLITAFEDYKNEYRKRVLRIIAKIPRANEKRFGELLLGSGSDDDHARVTEDFREIIFDGLEGMSAARDVPEQVVEAATDEMICSEADVQNEWGYVNSLELESLFGVKDGQSIRHFPASAFRGPFLPLLRFHPDIGLAFVIKLFNHSADWYAKPRVPREYVEPPVEISLTFADGTTKTQWCNDRLWSLYRGTSVGPYVLQSVLMALERGLLETAEADPDHLDALLLDILKKSENAAITAVVASVATAFPRSSGETLLVLLRSPECMVLDRHRMAKEAEAPSRHGALLPRLNAKNDVYDGERKEADSLPHRKMDLEMAIANVQLGPLADQVNELIDAYRAQMPPVEEQTEEDRVWRLALHRMDLRQYTVSDEPPAAERETSESSSQPQRHVVRLDLKEPEPDVQAMVAESASRFQDTNARLGLLMWGHSVFNREAKPEYDPSQWRQRLHDARVTFGSPPAEEITSLTKDGPGFVAAACVRDFWDEMTVDERNWCVDLICAEIETEANLWHQFARVQRGGLSADRPAASVLPLLLGKAIDDVRSARARRLLPIALTHAIDEVRSYAAAGIGMHLWGIDHALTLRCINALAVEATLVQEAVDADRQRPRNQIEVLDRQNEERTIDRIEAEAAARVRQQFYEKSTIPPDAYQRLDSGKWFAAEANTRILTIFGHAPTEPEAIAAFERLARTLVGWWDAEHARRRRRSADRPERNHQLEIVLKELLERFVMRTTPEASSRIIQPLLKAVDANSREVYWFVRGIAGEEDRDRNTAQFWTLWQMFADEIRNASWLADIDDEHSRGGELLSAIFLGLSWKEDVRHWGSLEGNDHRIHALFENLPPSATVLENYARFLYDIGERSLPGAFVRILSKLGQGSSRQLLQKPNTVFMLEVLLRRFVYGRPLELKRQPQLRDAVLALLDMLIDSGSSAAFRMGVFSSAGWLAVLFVTLEVIFLAAARDALAQHRLRSAQVLGQTRAAKADAITSDV
jgi:hypothetical protein